MGVDIRTVQRRAKSGSLTCEIQSNAKNRPEYIFPLSTLPKHVQERYYARHSLTLSTPEKTALQKVKPSPVQRPLDSYTDAERKEIGFWRDVVDQWMFYRSQPGKPLSELDAKFVRHMRVENPGQELSVATLYRKKKALEEGDLNSVIDRRGKARKGKTDMPEYIKKAFLYYYLVDGGEGHAYSITKCMEYTEKWVEKNAANALPLPSYSSFYRLAMDVPEAVRILMREGDRAYYNKASVYTRRDYESIASNDWWVGDTYTCDTLTLGPDGKTHRPYLTAWVDVRSGIFVGWYISFGGNSSQNSIYALRRGCLAHGMPNYNAYVDNGREYLTFDFGGRGHRAKKVLANGEAPLSMRQVLEAMIMAHEIQGVIALENSFNRVGLDHVLLVKVASTAVCAKLMGADREQLLAALSHAFVDGQALRTYRHAPNAGSRKSWAAGDATSRGVRLADIALRGEMGIPGVLSAPQWGFYDVLFSHTSKDLATKPEDKRRFSFPQGYGSYVMENVLFKISFPAEFHAQTAAEAAVRLHPLVKDRLQRISRIVITTHESAIRIISKVGPLANPADRDHCLQYMTAVPLIFGDLVAEHYEDAFHAAHPLIDRLREKMEIVEEPRYSREYLEADKRSIANAVEVFFDDGSSTGQVAVEYPLGHRRRRAEGIPLLQEKFKANLATRFPPQRCQRIFDLCSHQASLEATPVNRFMDLLAI